MEALEKKSAFKAEKVSQSISKSIESSSKCKGLNKQCCSLHLRRTPVIYEDYLFLDN